MYIVPARSVLFVVFDVGVSDCTNVLLEIR